MKKFGIGKKEKSDEVEDSKRSHLFGSKSSKSKSTAPAATNPYAAPQNNFAQDPYAKPSPYQQKPGGYGGAAAPPYGGDPSKSAVASQPPAYEKGGHTAGGGIANDRLRAEKTPVPPDGYGGARYGSSGSGNQTGYGADRYGGGSDGPSPRPGGYGGLGGPKEADDPNRGALFGGAEKRYDDRKAHGLPPQDSQPGGGYGASSGISSGMEHGTGGYEHYGDYKDRQLTAEEEEEEDVEDSKQQIRAMKQQDVSSTRNALRIAAQAEESGRGTLERLAAQGERIHNTEMNLDLASSHNRQAEEKARELKHLNRSMWAMQVNNPFTKSRRKAERDELIMNTHRDERDQRNATRAQAWASQQRAAETGKGLRGPAVGADGKKGNLAERSKYQFEADSEDEAMEDEIDANVEALGGATRRLNDLGKAMGKELEVQNTHIDRIGGKADHVDDGIAMNRARIDRIR